jgi:hypothetical protein
MALAGLASLRRQKGAEHKQLAASGVNVKSVKVYGAKRTGGCRRERRSSEGRIRTFLSAELNRSCCGAYRACCEALDCGGFGIKDAENSQKPRELKHIVELIAQIGQMQRCALFFGADVRSNQDA